jgi:betaine-aldehyde dehydrogenase
VTEKRELRNFIDGEFTDATSGAGMPVINPSTAEVYATAPLSGAEDVDAACRAAQRA